MASGRPLFPGSTVEDELHLIFKVLGTPNNYNCPGVERNSEFLQYNFPHYEPESLLSYAPRICPDGLDLLTRLLQVLYRLLTSQTRFIWYI